MIALLIITVYLKISENTLEDFQIGVIVVASLLLAMINSLIWRRQRIIQGIDFVGYFYQSLEPVVAISKQGRDIDSANATDGQNYVELRTKPRQIENRKQKETIDSRTVSDIIVPMKEILYVKDTEIINLDFAKKLAERELQGSWLMVRGFKDPKYWTSHQMSIDQPQIAGFIEVDKVIELGFLTKWSTYKIFQAVRNNDLEYKQAHYL